MVIDTIVISILYVDVCFSYLITVLLKFLIYLKNLSTVDPILL